MDALSILRILGRRWYVVIPVLVAAGWFGSQLIEEVPPVFAADGAVVVIETSAADGGGPTAGAVAARAEDGAIRQQVAAAGGSSAYTVVAEEGGVLRITADTDTPEKAVLTVTEVLDRMPEVLRSLDPRPDAVQVEELTRPVTVTTIPGEEEGQAPTYRARGAVQLVYASTQPALPMRQARDLLADVLTAPSTQSAVLRQEGEEYSIRSDGDSPVIGISAVSPTADGAQSLVARIMEQADLRWNAYLRTADADPTTTIEPLIAPTPGYETTRGTSRLMVALAAVSLALAVILAAVVEGLSVALRARRSRRADARAVEGDDADRPEVVEVPAAVAEDDGSDRVVDLAGSRQAEPLARSASRGSRWAP